MIGLLITHKGAFYAYRAGRSFNDETLLGDLDDTLPQGAKRRLVPAGKNVS